MNTEDKDHDAKIVVGVKFASTPREGQNARIVVGVGFMNTTGEDLRARTVAEARSVSTTSKDQTAPHAIPLDTLLRSYEAMFMMP